jgi:uncharacterized protein YbcC (UPF0753/DUF2309 family)
MISQPPIEDPSRAEILAAALRATRRIAPLWPLQGFVAVNPFLGLADHRFAEAARAMAASAGARLTMPRAFYAKAIRGGRITALDLADALAEAEDGGDLPADGEALRAAALAPDPDVAPRPLPTVADVAGAATGRDWAGFVTDRLSAWAAAFFDAGQAAWRSPWRDLGPYAAWRAEALVDRTPETMGLAGFRRAVGGLPGDASDALEVATRRIGMPAAALEAYGHRLLMTIGGWSGHARQRVWESELHGRPDASLLELLAIRLAWEAALLDCLADAPAVEMAWHAALGAYATSPASHPALAVDCLLQLAYERAWQRELAARFRARPEAAPAERPAVQAVFCIDVRSEVFRRALERAAPEVETIGFAGFFGLAIDYVPFGEMAGRAQCPVLLRPGVTIRETVRDAGPAEALGLLACHRLRRRAAGAWSAFRQAAVSSFAFVEAMGLTFLGRLARDGLGPALPASVAAGGGDPVLAGRLEPSLEPGSLAGRATGIDIEGRVRMAAAVLEAMGLRDGLARLVLLAGHGSTTTNNPYGSGLDCGACGGHAGEANARVAARLLNDPSVRAGLALRGIAVPADTVFVGGLHDTTTDALRILDPRDVPASHAADLARLVAWLAAAGELARGERAPALRLSTDRPIDAQMRARSRDWSEVRPEWGLAGCAAFVAAPRHRTRDIDLGGRAFLHSYDWRRDEGFRTLELVMTAPMVVASWISLQYYGSTVDNRVFGAGNKVLHNVVGRLGVIEGNGGDLRAGLPWQAVHDGERLVHEPLRLTVVIEAPITAINEVIARHGTVRQLADHGWLHLLALDDDGLIGQRYVGGLEWAPMRAAMAEAA